MLALGRAFAVVTCQIGDGFDLWLRVAQKFSITNQVVGMLVIGRIADKTAGIMEREARNNPQKAEPGEKAKERAEEKAEKLKEAEEAKKAAEEEAKAAAEAPAEEPAAEEAPAEEAAAEEARQAAEKALADQSGDFDYGRASAQLAEAAAQLRTLQKMRNRAGRG